MERNPRRRRTAFVLAAVAVTAAWGGSPAEANVGVPASMAGSTYAENAVLTWAAQQASTGETVSYTGAGSDAGFNAFDQGVVDSAVVDAQFGDGSSGFTTTRPHELIPLVSGGVVFAYHLTVGGKPLTGLRLTPQIVAGIFSGDITSWNDPLIVAANAGLLMPATRITPVGRSDDAATSDIVGRWLARTAPSGWSRMCAAAGVSAPCTPGPYLPMTRNAITLAGATNTVAYVQQSYGEGAITPVESTYATYTALSTAQVENAAGYYRSPAPANVAVAMQNAGAAGNGAVNLDAASASPDPRAYPLVTVSYLMAPTAATGSFTADKGMTLLDFAANAVCFSQQSAESLGYVPLTGSLLGNAESAFYQIPNTIGGKVTAPICGNLGDGLASQATQPTPADSFSPDVTGESLSTVLPPGALILSVPGTDVVLPSPVLDSTATDFHTSGQMAPVTVTDDRAGAPGWTLNGQVGDFGDGAGHLIDGSCLSWQPELVGDTAPAVTPGVPVARGAGGLKTPRTLATATGLGTARVGAELDLDAPTTTVAGTYSATLTITAI
jgi:phosphate transport system substrate-binding protein